MTTQPTWTRIRPGLYQSDTVTTLNGIQKPVTVRIREIPEWPLGLRWGVQIVHGDEELTNYSDGPVGTYREAKEAATASLTDGFELAPNLGWVAKG